MSTVSRVPVPPSLRALPVAFPARSSMHPSQHAWVDEVRNLAEAVTSTVIATQQNRRFCEKEFRTATKAERANRQRVDEDVAKVTEQVGASAKRIRQQLSVHEQEMALLLKARVKVAERLQAAKKPAFDLQRRIEHHRTAMPASELSGDMVEGELRRSSGLLQQAIDALERLSLLSERHVAYMQNLRATLNDEVTERDAVAVVNDGCASTGTLPPILSSVAGQLETLQSSSSGGSTTTSPRHPVVVRHDIKRALALSEAAVGESSSLRARMIASTKSLNEQVTVALDAVAASLRDRLSDTKALQTILRDRLTVAQQELAGVDDQLHQMSVAVSSLSDPTAAAQAKLSARGVILRSMRHIIGEDPVESAASQRLGHLVAMTEAQRKSLNHLTQQRSRLVALITRLQEVLDSKVALQQVDERLLHIGLTPAAPSPSSGRSVAAPSSGRAASSSRERRH